jgi:predicted nuclease of predicted toxin-antitoxin system
MRALLDENVPEGICGLFGSLEAVHVEHLGLKGVANGELLDLARADFDLLMTFDKGLPHQHAHDGYRLRILVLRLPDNKQETVERHLTAIEEAALLMREGELKEFRP